MKNKTKCPNCHEVYPTEEHNVCPKCWEKHQQEQELMRIERQIEESELHQLTGTNS
jgi:RNA polymerase subunit RPABC4/transcription elongation factor Spt4